MDTIGKIRPIRSINFKFLNLAYIWQNISAHRMAVILGICAFCIYLPGVWWGLPHVSNPITLHGWDEDSVSGMIVLSEFYNLLIQPRPDWWVAYPLFHYIILGFLYAPYLAYLYLTGSLSKPTAAYPFGFADPIQSIATLTIIGRFLTLAMAVGVVIIAYSIVQTLWDKRSAILAAITVMLLSPMFYYSRTGNLDVPVLFWTSLAILMIARSMRYGITTGRMVWLGIFSALAVTTKDQAYGALAPGIVLLLIFHFRNKEIPISRRWSHLSTLLLAGIVTFVISSGFLINPQRFWLHLHFIMDFKNTFPTVTRPDGQIMYGFGGNVLRPRTPVGYANLFSDIVSALSEAIGPLFILVALVGIILAWKVTPFAKILIGMGLGHIFLVIVIVSHMQYRYAIFPAFVLALFAGRALAVGWQNAPNLKLITALIGIVCLGWLSLKGVDLTYQMLFDARIPAAECLATQLKPGDKVGYWGDVNQLPYLPVGVTPVSLPSNDSAINYLEQNSIRYVLVSPDAWSDPGMDRSWFLPVDIYNALKNGSLGYQRLAVFSPPSLLGYAIRYLPIINPKVQVYGLPGDGLAKTGSPCQ
jgi:hypothetical protein